MVVFVQIIAQLSVSKIVATKNKWQHKVKSKRILIF